MYIYVYILKLIFYYYCFCCFHTKEEFVEYMNKSCTAYHAILASCEILLKAGFERLSESEEWKLKKNGKYFFTRHSTSVIAFTVGGCYTPGNGFTILGAHSDSPCLKVKPVTCLIKNDALMLNTQPYGGGQCLYM